MIRGTRQKQSRRISSKKKISPAKRVARSSSGASSRAFAHSAASLAENRPRGKAALHPPVKTAADIEREAGLKSFEAAFHSFRKKDYEKAIPLFEKVATGPIREFADRSRVYLRFCESRQKHESRPKTAEGCYARGVAALNSGDFDQAVQYLSKSDKLTPDQEYVHYALAAAYGRQGDQDHALSHLEAAIRLRPQNRILALHDDDFETLAGDPRFERLLVPEARQPLS